MVRQVMGLFEEIETDPGPLRDVRILQKILNGCGPKLGEKKDPEPKDHL